MPASIRPLMSDREYTAIERTLNSRQMMLEWGSGASTLRLSPKVGWYFSVEHDEGWYRRLLPLVEGSNVTLYLRAGPAKLPLPVPAERWEEIERSVRSNQYRGYIGIVAAFGCRFERVLIDGRARVECAQAIVPYLADDHLVFFHDFQRVRYQVVLERYNVAGRVGKLASLVLKQIEEFPAETEPPSWKTRSE